MILYCCGCKEDVDAKLVDGSVIYPHRPDLHSLPFWTCSTCNNYVGCHYKTRGRTTPLGSIPTPKIRAARSKIHGVLDPIWKSKKMSRTEVYNKVSKALGVTHFHTADVNSVKQANNVITVVKEINNAIL
tara:strand:+ start:345 stop:734 length:390 start_codon:yes stop_codon:yes gene_type:complete